MAKRASLPADKVPPIRMMRAFGGPDDFALPTSIRFVGKSMLVSDNSANPHLVVLDLTTGRITDRFGAHGRGPNEYSTPLWMAPNGLDTFVVYDRTVRRMDYVTVDGTGRIRLLRAASVPPVIPTYLFWAHPLGERVVGGGQLEPGALLIVDTVRRSLRHSGAPAFRDDELPKGVDRRAASWGHADVTYKTRRIAVAYHNSNRIDAFSSGGDFLGSMKGPRTPRLHYEQSRGGTGRAVHAPDSELGYLSVAATEDHIYGLYSGYGRESRRFARLVHVFKWDGTFVKEFALDRDVFLISVRPDSDLLYAATWEPEASLGEWRLP